MDSGITREIDEAKKAMENTIKIISELKDLENNESYLEKYAGLVENLLTTEKNLELHTSSFENARTAQTMAQFDAAYGLQMQQSQQEGVKRSKEYSEMMQTAKDYFSLATGEDILPTNTTLDDDLAIEENIPTVDPLTKGPLENPVKNKICGHIYGKKSMEEAIKRGNIRCPQMGCMNKQIVSLNHLEEDKRLKMQLAAIRLRTQAEEMEQDDSD